jgi:hypothetical protein
MKLSAKGVAWLLPLLLLTGCFHFSFHKTDQAQPLAPPIEDTPPPKPAPSLANLPPPVVTIPTPPAEPTASTTPQETPKPPVKHRRQTNKPAPDTTQMAAVEPPSVSAIGQLSSGDSSDLRVQTANSIAATERGLNGISRKLNDQEETTAAQIREFLKQARAALASGDVDGARTLLAKAKVLLGELNP